MQSYSSYNLMAPSKAFASTLLMTFLFISNFWRWGRRPNSPSDFIFPISLSFNILHKIEEVHIYPLWFNIITWSIHLLTIQWCKLVCLLVFRSTIFRNNRRLYHRKNSSTGTDRLKNNRWVSSCHLNLQAKIIEIL